MFIDSTGVYAEKRVEFVNKVTSNAVRSVGMNTTVILSLEECDIISKHDAHIARCNLVIPPTITLCQVEVGGATRITLKEVGEEGTCETADHQGTRQTVAVLQITRPPPIVLPTTLPHLISALGKLYGCQPPRSMLRKMQSFTNYDIRSLDFSLDYVGGSPRMGLVLVRLLRECVNVNRCSLQGHNLCFDTLQALFDSSNGISKHPSLTSIDLRGNYIEQQQAKLLLRSLRLNSRIVEVHFDDLCHLMPTTKKFIAGQLEENRRIMMTVNKMRTIHTMTFQPLVGFSEDLAPLVLERTADTFPVLSIS